MRCRICIKIIQILGPVFTNTKITNREALVRVHFLADHIRLFSILFIIVIIIVTATTVKIVIMVPVAFFFFSDSFGHIYICGCLRIKCLFTQAPTLLFHGLKTLNDSHMTRWIISIPAVAFCIVVVIKMVKIFCHFIRFNILACPFRSALAWSFKTIACLMRHCTTVLTCSFTETCCSRSCDSALVPVI